MGSYVSKENTASSFCYFGTSQCQKLKTTCSLQKPGEDKGCFWSMGFRTTSQACTWAACSLAVAQVCVGLHGKARVGQVPVVTIKTAWRVPRYTSAAQYRCNTRGLCASSGFTLAFYKLMLLATWHHWNLLGWRERRCSTREQPENVSTVQLCAGGAADKRPTWQLLPQVTVPSESQQAPIAPLPGATSLAGKANEAVLPAEEHLSTIYPLLHVKL